MMSISSENELELAGAEVKSHPRREDLAALAFEVVSSWAEGGKVFVGPEFADARARKHKLDKEGASSEGGNLLSVLERGPRSIREQLLVAAFAAEGLSEKLRPLGSAGEETLARFVRHADWLTLSTPFPIYDVLGSVLNGDLAGRVADAIGRAVLKDASDGSSPGSERPSELARQGARICALGRFPREVGRPMLVRVSTEAGDRVVRAIAAALLTDEDPATSLGDSGRSSGMETLELGGLADPLPPRTAFGAVMRWVSGYSVLVWVVRLVAYLIGVRREVSLRLTNEALFVARRTRLLGRVVREGQETYTLRAVAGAERSARFPLVGVGVGLLALALGVIVGGVFVVDGLRSGETLLLLAGASLILIGGGLDFGLTTLATGSHGRVALEVRVLPSRLIRVAGVPLNAADRFVTRLGRQGA